MARTKLTKYEKVTRYILNNRTASAKQIAEKCGCTVSYVYKLKSESGTPKEVFEAAAYEMTKHGKPKEVLGSAPTAVLKEPVVTRASILDKAKEYVTKDRAAQHGNMEDNFTNIEGGWAWWDNIKPDDLPNGIDTAVKMTLLKVARIASNPKHIDNWEDGCGYLACGGELAGKDV